MWAGGFPAVRCVEWGLHRGPRSSPAPGGESVSVDVLAFVVSIFIGQENAEDLANEDGDLHGHRKCGVAEEL